MTPMMGGWRDSKLKCIRNRNQNNHMTNQFSLDLRVARRKAGLTQRDVAQLLDVSMSHVCRLEQGSILPTLEQVVTLSLIFDCSFESLFSEVKQTARDHLCKRILNLPDNVPTAAATFNRDASIERLAHRLADELSTHGDD